MIVRAGSKIRRGGVKEDRQPLDMLASRALYDIKISVFLLKRRKAFNLKRFGFFLKPCVIFPQRIVVISHSTKVLSPV